MVSAGVIPLLQQLKKTPLVHEQDGEVLLDMVSLFPEENGPEGVISPFREDLLSLLKGLRPR